MEWPNVRPSALVEAAGVKVGVIGVMTRHALSMTLASNVIGLEVTALPDAIEAEIFEVARALPRGLVDVIFAGHTHAAVAHEVNGVAIVQAYARGRA